MQTVGNVFVLNNLQLLQISAVFELCVFVPLFLIAGFQDYKTTYIKGIVCFLIGIALAVNATCLSNSFLSIIIVFLCLVFTFGPITFKYFGQADFLMLGHFLTGYCNFFESSTWLLIAGITWLVCLTVHVMLYRDKNGNRWKPFSGMMIPALPSYATSVALVALMRIVFTNMLFFAGW